ncbi:hypothetical protein [Mesorhizobium sp.]
MLCSSTRCHTTTARSGRMTLPCAAPVWHALASVKA